jgi:acetyl-CoA carboxylase biotin carboxylase subunit
MERALDEFIIEGINTTIPFHQKLMKDPKFRKGDYTTKFMETFEM